jgi:hypothetical protein
MPAKPRIRLDSINWTALATGGTFIAGAAAFPGLPPLVAIIMGIIGYGLTAIGGTIEDEDPPKSGKDARNRFRDALPRGIVLTGAVLALCVGLWGCAGWQLGSISHEASAASVSVDGDEVEIDAISTLRICLERGRLEVCEELRPSVYWLRSEGTLYLCASHRMIPASSACVPIPLGED